MLIQSRFKLIWYEYRNVTEKLTIHLHKTLSLETPSMDVLLTLNLNYISEYLICFDDNILFYKEI